MIKKTGFDKPDKFILTPGQTHDITQAKALTADFRRTVPADRGYDSDPYRHYPEPAEPYRSSLRVPAGKTPGIMTGICTENVILRNVLSIK